MANKKNPQGQKFRAPRECVQLMYWQGTQVNPGEVYGVDEKGPYVTDKTMYKGFMSFRRPSVINPLFWSTCKEPKSAETVHRILARWVSMPPVKTSALEKARAEEIRKARQNSAAAIWRGEQASVIQKRGMKFKARQHGNCAEYRNATRAVYGDDVEINGRQVPVTDKIGFYLDGGTIR